jgi:hypothetical protein
MPPILRGSNIQIWSAKSMSQCAWINVCMKLLVYDYLLTHISTPAAFVLSSKPEAYASRAIEKAFSGVQVDEECESEINLGLSL